MMLHCFKTGQSPADHLRSTGEPALALVWNYREILGKASMDVLNQFIIHKGNYKKIDWVNVAASGLIKNSILKNAISSIMDFNIEEGYDKSKSLNEMIVEFAIRTGADALFNDKLTGKAKEWQDQIAKDLVKKYTRKKAKDVYKDATNSEESGTPES